MFSIAAVNDALTPCQYGLDLAFRRIKRLAAWTERKASSLPWNRFWLLVNRLRIQEPGCLGASKVVLSIAGIANRRSGAIWPKRSVGWPSCLLANVVRFRAPGISRRRKAITPRVGSRMASKIGPCSFRYERRPPFAKIECASE